MENATDALIMAGSVLLLIIALTVSISSLSRLRGQAQDILSERDKLQFTQDENGYINYQIADKNALTRNVGIETIMSAITRMRKESYNIYIATGESIDLPDKMSELKIDSITDDSNVLNGNNNVIKLTVSKTGNKYIEDDELKGKLYNQLNGKTFDEYIGIYQRENDASEANKETYKIITFVENN